MVFDWMTLSETLEWEKIDHTILYLNNNGVGPLSDNLFGQYIMYLKNFLEVKLASEEWKSICNSVEEKWIYFFERNRKSSKKMQTVETMRVFVSNPRAQCRGWLKISFFFFDWVELKWLGDLTFNVNEVKHKCIVFLFEDTLGELTYKS